MVKPERQELMEIQERRDLEEQMDQLASLDFQDHQELLAGWVQMVPKEIL